MEIKINIDEDKGIFDSEEEENNEIDGEVDLEEEIVCALIKIKKLRKNNLKQKEKLHKYEVEDCDSKAKMSQSLEELEKNYHKPKISIRRGKRDKISGEN
jgi:hypothetical protein